jgi:hydrogenase maturation factor
MWRACHDLLPTRVNLYKRKIINDPMCPLCGLVEETTTHVLWLCSAASDVWSMGDMRLQKSKAHGEDFFTNS